jgi:hypothetical protein
LKFKTFEDALSPERKIALTPAEPKIGPIAANDNKRRKGKPYRNRTTLPALNWLYKHHAHLAEAFARAIPKPGTVWSLDVADTKQDIRPTVGELIAAVGDGIMKIVPKARDRFERISLGNLKFRDGVLVEWNVTKKGRRLGPVDRLREGGTEKASVRNPGFYLRTKARTKSPFEAHHYHRPISDLPALAPMYDPLPRAKPSAQDKHGRFGVAEAREVLKSHGVDGSVTFSALPYPAQRCGTVVAKGASFIGGVSRLSGNSSSGAVSWDVPEKTKGQIATIIEEVAAKGTLKSIGKRLGYSKEYADRAGKAALVEAAEWLAAANDNKKVAADVPNLAGLQRM